MTVMTLESKVKVISFLQSNYMGAQAGLRLYIFQQNQIFLGFGQFCEYGDLLILCFRFKQWVVLRGGVSVCDAFHNDYM